MKVRKRVVVIAAVAGGAAVAVAGTAVATQGGDEAGSNNYTQQQADDATKAALDATGGGTANSVERDSENGATWEVEVTKTDGATVDVRLDASYDVVVIEGDSESGDSGDSGDE